MWIITTLAKTIVLMFLGAVTFVTAIIATGTSTYDGKSIFNHWYWRVLFGAISIGCLWLFKIVK